MLGILQGWAPKVRALSPNGEVEGKSFRSRSKLEGFDTWVFPKIVGFPPIINSNRVFPYKPSILGYPYFLETPTWKPKIGGL